MRLVWTSGGKATRYLYSTPDQRYRVGKMLGILKYVAGLAEYRNGAVEGPRKFKAESINEAKMIVETMVRLEG